MAEITRKSGVFRRFMLVSPWLPLFFICLFALSLYVEFAQFPLPSYIPSPNRIIMVNNFCFMLLIALRFFNQLGSMRRKFCYSDQDRPLKHISLDSTSLESMRQKFASAGFCFSNSGYGEKRDLSRVATSMVYGGIFLALLIGNYDNLRFISGSFTQGQGAPSSLDDARLYSNLIMGPLSSLKSLPVFQIKTISYGAAQRPEDTAEIVLYDKSHTVLAQGTAARGGETFVHNGVGYDLKRVLIDVPLQIGTDKGRLEFEGTLKVRPLNPPLENYSYFASFEGVRLQWDLLYDPVGRSFKLLGGQGGKKLVDGVYVFGRDSSVVMGPFYAKIHSITERAEIQLVHPRHLAGLFTGLVLAVLGALMSLFCRPQRVWLEASTAGCRVWAVGRDSQRLVHTGK